LIVPGDREAAGLVLMRDEAGQRLTVTANDADAKQLG
jgi:hypothetical protein